MPLVAVRAETAPSAQVEVFVRLIKGTRHRSSCPPSLFAQHLQAVFAHQAGDPVRDETEAIAGTEVGPALLEVGRPGRRQVSQLIEDPLEPGRNRGMSSWVPGRQSRVFPALSRVLREVPRATALRLHLNRDPAGTRGGRLVRGLDTWISERRKDPQRWLISRRCSSRSFESDARTRSAR